jgi:hypothetical protein
VSVPPDQNILSLSIPTDLLTGAGGGSGGGLNLNYNFGPNVDTIANNAYSFLGQTFAGAQAFENNSIGGTQDFLSSNVAPITSAVAGEADDYFNQILGAFGTVTNAQSASASQAITAEQQVSNASINASKKAAGGGSIFSSIFGGCFITTAVCKYSGLPDDCDVLQTMRKWRDTWMQETPERRAMVERYYIVAPIYVAKIHAKEEREQVFTWLLLNDLINLCVSAINQDLNHNALAIYLAAVELARVSAEDTV